MHDFKQLINIGTGDLQQNSFLLLNPELDIPLLRQQEATSFTYKQHSSKASGKYRQTRAFHLNGQWCPGDMRSK